jgi:chromosome segregation ATPase
MKNKIVKLTESDLETLVKKIIKEEEEQSKETKTTLTRHPAYPAIDKLENELERLKMSFKNSIANAVSGEDGYHSEIDKFSEDFGKFITKVSNLKSKINDYQIANKDKEMAEAKARKEKQRQYQQYMRERARKDGRNYSY